MAARVLHVLAVALLAALYVLVPLHPVYLAGVAAVAALLVYEHSLVSADDLSRVNAAFFTVNGWISVGLPGVHAARPALGKRHVERGGAAASGGDLARGVSGGSSTAVGVRREFSP